MSSEQKPRGSADNTESEDAISIPLYLSGLVVSLVGIVAVNSALSDTQFGSTTLMLTILGFIFSIACRWLRIKLRVLEVLGLCIAVYFGCRFLTHSFSLAVFIPPDVTQGDIIMAIVLEWLTVVRAWVLTNDESVVFTSVTSVAMIGLVGASNINTELLIYFFIYTIFATFLLLHQTYLVQRSWTTSSLRDKSESGVIQTQALMSIFSGVVALLIGVVVVIPLRAVGSHLSLANALKSFVGNQHGGDSSNTALDSTVSLSDDETFKIGTGSGESATNVVVLRAMPRDHQEHYYRGRTYDVYEGNEWVSSLRNDGANLRPSFAPTPSESVSAFSLVQPSDPGGDESQPMYDPSIPLHSVFTRFTIAGSSTSTLYVPYGTQTIYLPDNPSVVVSQSADNHLSLNVAMDSGFVYASLSYYPDSTPMQLRQAEPLPHHCPLALVKQYIDQRGGDVVSLDDQERLMQTANGIIRTLPRNRRTEFDIAEGIREWVSHRCLYSLDVGSVPSNEDAVSYFLFDSRRGYCDLFASSMAILCRYAGIPARVATGFAPGQENQHGSFDLHERDKHAWVEIWFPKIGWQEFDPTEGASEDGSITNANYESLWFKNGLLKFREFFLVGGFSSSLLDVLFVLSLLYVIKTEVYDRFFSRKVRGATVIQYSSLDDARKASPQAAAIYSRGNARSRYARFESVIRRAGLAREKDQTPLEFLAAVKETLLNGDSAALIETQDFCRAAEVLTADVMLASYAPLEFVGTTLVEREELGLGDDAEKTIVANARFISNLLGRSAKAVARSGR